MAKTGRPSRRKSSLPKLIERYYSDLADFARQNVLWLHFQPDSELSRWFRDRFGRGSGRQRRIGIVALARKLLVQLWKYLETGVPPAGATLTDWQAKARTTARSFEAA